MAIKESLSNPLPIGFKDFSKKTHKFPVLKVRDTDDTLIQYKESAFLSDMLSSSKD